MKGQNGQPQTITHAEKMEIVNQRLRRLMDIALNGKRRKDYELTLTALSAYAMMQYSINQVYTDQAVEALLSDISEELVHVPEDYRGESRTVLFYDGFGLDLRGWAATFAKGLSELGYRLVYVTKEECRETIPHIRAEVEKNHGIMRYIKMNGHFVQWVQKLHAYFLEYKPSTAFFYTLPDDVSGAVVFNAYAGKVKRIQIDLTDHAFWVGVNAFDYSIDSRLPGVSNAVYQRGIAPEKIKRMDCCPYINRDVDSTPLPFDIGKEKYVFSGGALYKTLGDENLYFYQMADHILANHADVRFLYAGEGDDTELQKLVEKYPGRAFHIHERSDFIRLFENCLFLLNTYPMFGGLMMRYAALCGKVPLTLKHGQDHAGILYDQEQRGVEFDTYEEAVAEADRLILDEDYRKSKEKRLDGAVMSEKRFADNVRSLIEEGTTDSVFEEIPNIDTSAFRAEYLERLDTESMFLQTIPIFKNGRLLPYFPGLFLKKIFGKLKK